VRGLLVAMTVVLAVAALPATAVSASAQQPGGAPSWTWPDLAGTAEGPSSSSEDLGVGAEPLTGRWPGHDGDLGSPWGWPAPGSGGSGLMASLPRLPGLRGVVNGAPEHGLFAQLPQPADPADQPVQASCAGPDGRGYAVEMGTVSLRIWLLGAQVWTRVWHPGHTVDVTVSTNGDDPPMSYRSTGHGNLDRPYREVQPGTVVHMELVVDDDPLEILFLCRVPQAPSDPQAPDLGDVADALGLGLGYTTDEVPTAHLPPCRPGLVAQGRGGARLILRQHEGRTSWNVDLTWAQELMGAFRGRSLEVSVHRGEPDADLVDFATSALPLGPWRTFPAELTAGDRVGILVWGRPAPLFLPNLIAELECRMPGAEAAPAPLGSPKTGKFMSEHAYGTVDVDEAISGFRYTISRRVGSTFGDDGQLYTAVVADRALLDLRPWPERKPYQGFSRSGWVEVGGIRPGAPVTLVAFVYRGPGVLPNIRAGVVTGSFPPGRNERTLYTSADVLVETSLALPGDGQLGVKPGQRGHRTAGLVPFVVPEGFDEDGTRLRHDETLTLKQKGNTCGSTSCAMVVASFGKHEAAAAILEAGGEWATTTEVVDRMRGHGLNARVDTSLSMDELIEATGDGRPVAAAVHVRRRPEEKWLFHRVVVDGVTEILGHEVVAVRAPKGIKYYQLREVFERQFAGMGIVVDR